MGTGRGADRGATGASGTCRGAVGVLGACIGADGTSGSGRGAVGASEAFLATGRGARFSGACLVREGDLGAGTEDGLFDGDSTFVILSISSRYFDLALTKAAASLATPRWDLKG